MKKLKLVSSIVLLVAVMAIAGFNVTKNKNANRVSDLALANVEALADDGENPNTNNVSWYDEYFWQDGPYKNGNKKYYIVYHNIICSSVAGDIKCISKFETSYVYM